MTVGCASSGLYVVVVGGYSCLIEKREREQETKNIVKVKNNNKERIFK